MSDIITWEQGPPHVDDGQDVNARLPDVYSKNGDLFVNVAFGQGLSILNQSILNGYTING